MCFAIQLSSGNPATGTVVKGSLPLLAASTIFSASSFNDLKRFCIELVVWSPPNIRASSVRVNDSHRTVREKVINCVLLCCR
jgi:hypothetical protein